MKRGMMRSYDSLSTAQRESIFHGTACGHPANRPLNERAARLVQWEIIDGKVVGQLHKNLLSEFFPS